MTGEDLKYLANAHTHSIRPSYMLVKNALYTWQLLYLTSMNVFTVHTHPAVMDKNSKSL